MNIESLCWKFEYSASESSSLKFFALIACMLIRSLLHDDLVVALDPVLVVVNQVDEHRLQLQVLGLEVNHLLVFGLHEELVLDFPQLENDLDDLVDLGLRLFGGRGEQLDGELLV